MLFGKKKEKDSTLDLDVPEFQSGDSQKPAESPKFPSFEHEFGTIKKEIGKPSPMQKKRIMPKPATGFSPANRVSPAGDKPIFVKLESYKEAMENIDKIKGLCNEADSLLDKIHKIRTEEDRELENWHRDLDKVKDKLLTVDKKLFEPSG
jgi:hypothetical protein